jgi:hypothetical protein
MQTDIFQMRAGTLLLIVMICVGFAVVGKAQAPNHISYQGRLTDATGSPLNSTVSLSFRLYDESGVELWAEVHELVSVNDGLFHVLLGSIEAFPDGLFQGASLQLGIQVGDEEELEPRTSLSSVPYAHRATSADSAQNASAGSDLATLSGDQTFTGSNSFSGPVVIGSADAKAQSAEAANSLEVQGSASVTGTLTVEHLLFTVPVTGYYTVGPGDFVPEIGVVGMEMAYLIFDAVGGVVGNIGASYGSIVAPIHLPHGAVITEFTLHIHCGITSTPINVNAVLIRQRLTQTLNPVTEMAAVSVDEVSSTGYHSLVDRTIDEATVSNDLYCYYIHTDALWDGYFVRVLGATIGYYIE